VQTLAAWAQAHGAEPAALAGERLLLPRLAAGQYQVCLGPAGWAVGALHGQGGEAGLSCAAGTLGAGERLRLRVVGGGG
jgi:hypothetical protein